MNFLKCTPEVFNKLCDAINIPENQREGIIRMDVRIGVGELVTYKVEKYAQEASDNGRLPNH